MANTFLLGFLAKTKRHQLFPFMCHETSEKTFCRVILESDITSSAEEKHIPILMFRIVDIVDVFSVLKMTVKGRRNRCRRRRYGHKEESMVDRWCISSKSSGECEMKS